MSSHECKILLVYREASFVSSLEGGRECEPVLQQTKLTAARKDDGEFKPPVCSSARPAKSGTTLSCSRKRFTSKVSSRNKSLHIETSMQPLTVLGKGQAQQHQEPREPPHDKERTIEPHNTDQSLMSAAHPTHV